MVEFALILPVLLLLLVGIFKAGILYNRYISLTDAVRVGTRELALGRGKSDPCSPAVQRTIDAVTSITLTSSSDPANVAGPGQVKVTLLTPDTCGTLKPGGTLANKDLYQGAVMAQGDVATLSATYPCDLVLLGINFFPGCTLKASASEAIE